MSDTQQMKCDFQILLQFNEETKETQWHFLDGDGNHIGSPNIPVEYEIIWKAQKVLLSTLNYWNDAMKPMSMK